MDLTLHRYKVSAGYVANVDVAGNPRAVALDDRGLASADTLPCSDHPGVINGAGMLVFP